MSGRRVQVAKVIWFFIFLFLAMEVCGKPALAEEAVLYTKYNIHVQKQFHRDGTSVYKASYANYTNPGAGHMVVPAGSPIVIEKTSRRFFDFLCKTEGITVRFEFNQSRMGMGPKAYISLITSPSRVSLKKFDALDRKGIEEGKAMVGMTKEGILTTLGYPAVHRTPSLDASTWIYWTNRFGTLAVHFNDQGKVTDIKD